MHQSVAFTVADNNVAWCVWLVGMLIVVYYCVYSMKMCLVLIVIVLSTSVHTVYVDNCTRIIFRFINVHVTLISRIIHAYGIHVYSGKDLDAFNFTKTCHREIKVTLKLSTYTVYYTCTCDYDDFGGCFQSELRDYSWKDIIDRLKLAQNEFKLNIRKQELTELGKRADHTSLPAH